MTQSNPRTMFAAFLLSLVASPLFAQVVVNEVNTGDPDYIEIANLGTSVADISGWKVGMSFGTIVYSNYEIPAGTFLAPGAVIVLLESQATFPTNAVQPLPGTTVLNTGTAYGWNGVATGAVALTDATGGFKDLVVFGTGTVTIPPIAAGQVFTNPINRSQNSVASSDVVFRNSIFDTDDGADWSNTQDGTETPGSLNPGQGIGAYDVAALEVQTAPIGFDLGQHTFQMTATIVRIKTTVGGVIESPVVDSLIGGTMHVSGFFVGNDLSGMSDIILAPATIEISATNGHQASTTVILQGSSDLDWSFIGALPHGTRRFTAISTNGANEIGAGSLAVQKIAARMGQEVLTLRADVTDLSTIAGFESFEFAPTPTSDVFAAKLATNGQGSLDLGVINGEGDEIWNVFAINSTIDFGTGPCFGIEFGALQYSMVVAPLGTAPFHVAPDARGAYAFRLPSGVVPPGLVVDHVAVKAQNGFLFASAPSRVAF